MAECIQLTLPGRKLLSRNVLDKMSWRARHRHSKGLKREIGYCILQARAKKSVWPASFAVVSIVSNRKQLLDPDNLIAGAKSYVDALVTNRILVDDKPENIKLTVQQFKAKDYSVVINVEQVQTELT